ncbi:MAG: hypothetical protein NVSMB47_08410 [Polyangiales bacterium]
MDSHAMLRKEADGRTILARVREVMLPRLRIEARIAQGGEVRGRLDDLSAASLLEITSRLRREASIVVRDAVHIFEIELDGGGIRALSRATTDGELVTGVGVLPSLLGVVGGRFLVRAPSAADARAPTIDGDLNAQLAPVLRRLRAACDALTGAHTVEVASVALESSLLAWYLRATPPPVRALLERIAQGASPRAMILGGEIAPATLEDVLLDVAARGMVTGARGEKGEDLLAAADRALEFAPSPLIDAHAGARSSARASAAPASAVSPGVDLGDMMPPSVAPPPPRPEIESASPASLADAVLVASTGERRTGSKPSIDTRATKPCSMPTCSDPPPGSDPRSHPPNERRSPSSAGMSATPTRPRRQSPEHASATGPRVDTLAGIGLNPGEVQDPATTMPPPGQASAPAGRPPSTKPAALTPPPPPSEEALAAERAERDRAQTATRESEERAREARELAEAAGRAAQERAERDERERTERATREREQREFEDKLAARRRRSSAGGEPAAADEPPPVVVAPERPSQRPRVSSQQAAAARKRLRSDAVFWWIVLALGVAGASIAFYVQQQEESAPKPAVPAASASPSP